MDEKPLEPLTPGSGDCGGGAEGDSNKDAADSTCSSNDGEQGQELKSSDVDGNYGGAKDIGHGDGGGHGGGDGADEGSEDDFLWCIHVWSGPRSLSTSLMYSFAQRSDMEVVDEPLYAHFLEVSGAERPYRDLVLKSMDSDAARVLQNVIFEQRKENKKYRFAKHMAKQCTPLVAPLVKARGRHVLLIRDPTELIPSFAEVSPPTLEETGLPHLLSLFSLLSSPSSSSSSASPHSPPPIVDAADLRTNPEGTLRALCSALHLPFDAAMLSWRAGPRPEDGCWAPWWYSTVHRSTGFEQPLGFMAKPFPPSHYDLLESALPFYSALKRHVLQPVPASQASFIPPPLLPSLPVKSNEKILVWVGGRLLPRSEAKVSVFDSIVQGGDGVWEGLRIYNGRIFNFDAHMDRLIDSAKAMAFANVPSREEITRAVVATLAANGMRDGAHVRLTLTRGPKVTSGMSPHFNVFGCTLIVLAEWKPPVYDNNSGIRLVTASTRRNPPQCVDSKIHHNNLINNILAKIEGNNAGVDDAVMLDVDGFVSETNATNIFMVKKGVVLTPFADSCLPGITRETVIKLAKEEGLLMEERRISLSQLHTADEVFTTGTMGELSPCIEIDKRVVGSGKVGPTTRKLQRVYAKKTEGEGFALPF